MTEKFPKSYVIERIDARKGRLSLAKSKTQAELDALQESLLGALDSIFNKNVTAVEAAWDRAKAARKEYSVATTFAEKYKIANEMRNINMESTYAIRHHERPTSIKKSASIDELKRALNEIERETESLDHARIYLEDLPVDEFTLASLRSLGLLSILKFDLADRADTKK